MVSPLIRDNIRLKEQFAKLKRIGAGNPLRAMSSGPTSRMRSRSSHYVLVVTFMNPYF